MTLPNGASWSQAAHHATFSCDLYRQKTWFRQSGEKMAEIMCCIVNPASVLVTPRENKTKENMGSPL